MQSAYFSDSLDVNNEISFRLSACGSISLNLSFFPLQVSAFLSASLRPSQWLENTSVRGKRWLTAYPCLVLYILTVTFYIFSPSHFLFLLLIPDSSPHLYHHVNFHLIFRYWNWDLHPGPHSPTPHRALFLEGSSAFAGSICLQHMCLRCFDEAAATKRKKNKVSQDQHHLSCFIVVQSTVLFLRWILACDLQLM